MSRILADLAAMQRLRRANSAVARAQKRAKAAKDYYDASLANLQAVEEVQRDAWAAIADAVAGDA